MSLLDADWGTDKPPRPAHDHNTHTGMCACGKNGTAEAHGLQRDEDGKVIHRALACDEAEAIRQRVARDITRDSMSRWERLTSWVTGRGGDYSQEAYQRAFPSRQDLTPEQQAYWAAYDETPLSWTEWKTQQTEQGRAR